MSKSLEEASRDAHTFAGGGATEARRDGLPDVAAEAFATGYIPYETSGSATLRNRSVQVNAIGMQPLSTQRDAFRIEVAPLLDPQRRSLSTEDLTALLPSSPTGKTPVTGKPSSALSPLEATGRSFPTEDISPAGGGAIPSLAVVKQQLAPSQSMLRIIATLALPISVSQVAQFSITMFMLAAVGHIGVAEMGGASVGFGLVNATAFAFSSGLCGALETLLAQTFGRDPSSKQYGLYAQRMLLVLTLFAVPITLCLLYAEPMLLLMGEPATVAHFAGRFCRVAGILAVVPVMLLELLRRYYVSQRRPNPVFTAVVVCAMVNMLVVYQMVNALGYDGIAVAFAVITGIMDVGLLLHLRITGLYRQTWGGWSAAAFHQWGPLLKLALPSLAMGLSEWTSMEVNSVVAGFGTEVELAAYAVSSQIASLCWAVPAGIYMAATVLVGNSIGSGSPALAKRYAKATSYIAIVLALANCSLVVIFARWIASHFTEDEAVLLLFASRVAPAMAAYHVADTITCNGLAILRGCGHHMVGMAIMLSSLAVVGTPLGVFAFLRGYIGVEALWYGPLVGYLVVGVPALAYVLFCYVDWQNLKVSTGETFSAH